MIDYFIGDLNETLFVGEVSESAKKLVEVTWECLEKAIESGKYSFYHSFLQF